MAGSGWLVGKVSEREETNDWVSHLFSYVGVDELDGVY